MFYIMHGRGSTHKDEWIPWLKSELESKDYEVDTPKMPFVNFPSPEKWAGTLDKLVDDNKSNNFVAFSLSTQTVLRYIASGKGNPNNIYLVAPFQEINYEAVYDKTISEIKVLRGFAKEFIAKISVKNSHKWCNTELPWDQLKDYQGKLHIIFSDNDHYVSQSQIDLFQSKLPDASYQIVENAGHFTKNDGYTKFPLLLDTIVNTTNRG
ncbi:alpha/beta hydrolase [Bacteroidota bacterium]